ncbi:Lrp/AsnC family transcriptional regulator [Streptomyces sp. XM4193]|uniref:Lrp/AsnC family transcriptional regulator n=1 Tax=Streptomyces sp. XM4193 TaxID=2929782 RepID=UPI001FFA8582|nr:Lrp/AsnC family transcriptional regulator [Streptomyces sp. XM4193]MCK1794693.1 Lrp/AsnC family transcriptional regulator [Streptomyces sp. XM4193]
MKDSVRTPVELDETDLALAHALQIAPRAPWSTVGAVLELSPVTVARRWSRITDAGVAWVTATGSPELWRSLCNAFISVNCEPALRSEVALSLARDPRTKSVMELASGPDIHVNTVTRDLPGLSRFVLDQVSRIPGVLRVETQITTRILTAGSAWRLDALSRAQQQTLQRHAAETGAAPVPRLSDADRALLLALAPDARRNIAELARLTGTNETAARRRLHRLEREGAVSFRCEVAQHVTGWPVTSLMWGSVPSADWRRACEQLGRLPQVRLLTTTSGSTNVFLSCWLHSLDAALDLEERVAVACPAFERADHAMVMRTVKRQGWILDDLGRRLSSAPIDPWYEDDVPPLPNLGTEDVRPRG